MNRFITLKVAVTLLLAIYSLSFLFHVAVICGILFFDYVPLDFLWGGRMESREALLVFEIISASIILLFAFITYRYNDSIIGQRNATVLRLLLMVIFVIFLLNTVGNVFAKTSFEQTFSVVTGLLALLTLRIFRETPKPENS